ncbi:MAG: MBOAT family O-acyltransferase [Clostridia bacterium]|nr:MBOAT family O-acyltransferase [Clostridia bacterium]
MVFSSLTFLCVFLPAVLLLYSLSKNITYKNTVLAVFSLTFYAWGEPSLIILLIAATIVNYFLAFGIGAAQNRDKKAWAKVCVTLAIIFDIAMIGVFKYAAFAVSSVNGIFGFSFPIPEIGLPLGISFYTFQILTYVLDVYRKDTPVQKSYLKFITFVSMFPQLIAGPIVRYQEVAEGLDDRKVTVSEFADGATQFVIGLGKKVFLANFAGDAKDVLFAASTAPTVLSAWLGIIFYSFQLYFDFSGYSDMAIGMGKMIGFKFPKNFNYPYISRSVTEFWRRWHMTLGSFFRDYVYIPMGGNRCSKLRWVLNIMVVWALTGLWHGASWNFVLWGVYYGVLLLIEKLLFSKWSKVPVLSNITTLFFVVIGWTLFYFTDFSQLTAFFGTMFGQNGPLYDITTVSVFYGNIVLLGALILASTPLPYKIFEKLISIKGIGMIIEAVVLVGLFAACLATLTGATSNPFLYFRF